MTWYWPVCFRMASPSLIRLSSSVSSFRTAKQYLTDTMLLATGTRLVRCISLIR